MMNMLRFKHKYMLVFEYLSKQFYVDSTTFAGRKYIMKTEWNFNLSNFPG